MIGSTELIAILIAALFLFGPQKLPELARSLGSAMGEFKKAQRAAELELTEFDSYTRKAASKAREKEGDKEGVEVSPAESGKEKKDSENSNKKTKANPLNALECRPSLPDQVTIPENQNTGMK
ncbi:MAG TPA: twin-arginine translocase TatA/TatE family subunit [Methanosarcina sp.]|jgi:sec-independent protein translocase protein TatA|nr:twin-arginine translocase TatA/TatE family subunit [Methanosarcina sp.]HOW13836.1 twin-arginine translocase TatA/TatE family subunit [Methanosarcina sp.]